MVGKTSPQTCFRATTQQNVFTQSLNALLCSPCGFVSPKQLVVQSQCHLAGKRYGCLYCFIMFYQFLSINLMIVHLYKSQQVYSTSVNLLLEQRKQTEQQKKQKNLDLDVSTVCETPSCWQRNVLELMGNQQLHVVGRWDDSPFFVCASEDGG